MLLSNKAILVELWKRYPNHPLLVETHHFDPQQKFSGKWVKKPILAREGANIRVLQDGQDQGLLLVVSILMTMINMAMWYKNG
jgi:glutathionylspermidine synthase